MNINFKKIEAMAKAKRKNPKSNYVLPEQFKGFSRTQTLYYLSEIADLKKKVKKECEFVRYVDDKSYSVIRLANGEIKTVYTERLSKK